MRSSLYGFDQKRVDLSLALEERDIRRAARLSTFGAARSTFSQLSSNYLAKIAASLMSLPAEFRLQIIVEIVDNPKWSPNDSLRTRKALQCTCRLLQTEVHDRFYSTYTAHSLKALLERMDA